MLPLVVHIQSPQGGTTVTRAFHESPVRIGRSPFANLRLREPFVSEWHAVVRFHGDRTTYLDLGSRNPTHVQGRPIERNIEVEVDADTDIRIGPLRLRFERTNAARELSEAVPQDETAFAPEQLLAKEPTGTIALSAPHPGTNLRTPQSPVPSTPRPGLGQIQPHHPRTQIGASPLGATPVGTPARPFTPLPGPPPHGQAGDPLQAFAREFDRARDAFLDAVSQYLQTGPEAQRAERVRSLATQYPRLVEEPVFRRWAQTLGVDPAALGHVDVTHWLRRLCGANGAPARPEHVALTMERVGQLLELFASSFIESRRAHHRARKKLGLDNGIVPNNVLQQSEDPHAVLAYLLEPSSVAQLRSQELRRSLGDFAMHQIALLSAVVEGARSMLTQLAPRALQTAADPTDTAVLDSEHGLADVWPLTARKLWRRFLVRHHDLVQTDHFARELFGREFTRRYHAIADATNHAERGDTT